MSYYVLIDDEQVGPLEFGAVAEMVERGAVVAETLGWTGGMADWEPVSKIPALASLFDAPRAPVSPQRPAAPGQEQPLDIELVFNTAVGAFKNQFGATFLVSLLYNLVSSGILVLIFGMAVVAGITAEGDDSSTPFMRFSLIGVVLMMVVMPILYGGLSTAMLSLVRGEPVRPGQLLAGLSRGLTLVLFWLIYAIACSIGMLFLVFPGLLIAASFMLTPFVIMESQLGTIEAMKAGYRATLSLGWWRCVFLLAVLLIALFVVSLITDLIVRSLGSPLATFVVTLLVNSLVTVVMVASLAAAYEQARVNRENAAVGGSD